MHRHESCLDCVPPLRTDLLALPLVFVFRAYLFVLVCSSVLCSPLLYFVAFSVTLLFAPRELFSVCSFLLFLSRIVLSFLRYLVCHLIFFLFISLRPWFSVYSAPQLRPPTSSPHATTYTLAYHLFAPFISHPRSQGFRFHSIYIIDAVQSTASYSAHFLLLYFYLNLHILYHYHLSSTDTYLPYIHLTFARIKTYTTHH